MINTKGGFIIPLIVILIIVALVIGSGIYIYSHKTLNIQFNQNASSTLTTETTHSSTTKSNIVATSTLYNKVNSGTRVMCTEDAKLCPDGSYVGRIGPNCEFAQCPGGNYSSQ